MKWNLAEKVCFFGALILIAFFVAYDNLQAPTTTQTLSEANFQSLLSEEHDKGVARSTKWEGFERKCVAAHPYCAACGANNEYLHAVGGHLEAHHIHGFKFMSPAQRGTDAPGGELDPDNIIILCRNGPRNDHVKIGHNGNLQGPDNENVVADCASVAADLKERGKYLHPEPIKAEEEVVPSWEGKFYVPHGERVQF